MSSTPYMMIIILRSSSVCYLNVRSLRNKAIYVLDYDVSRIIDVLALPETWLVTDKDQLTINKLVPGGYKFNHIPRKRSRRGGGIGILYKSTDFYGE